MRCIAPFLMLLLVLAACDEKTMPSYDAVGEDGAVDDADTGDATGDPIPDFVPEPVLPPDECLGPNPPPTGPRVDFDVDCEPCLGATCQQHFAAMLISPSWRRRSIS